MSNVWDAVHESAELVAPNEALRITNLAIAAANRHANTIRRKQPGLDARCLRSLVAELALSPLEDCSDDKRLWNNIAARAIDAAHLGNTPEGMHIWAAAYQRASTTQKAMGAYATHSAFATALVRATLGPLSDRRAFRIVDPSVGAGNLLLAAIEQFGRGLTDSQLKRFVLSLHGVELDPKARELCCLLIWLAGTRSGVGLNQISEHICLANALTRDWWSDTEPFDVLVMNPPWESLRHTVDNDEPLERRETSERLSRELDGAPGLPPLFTAQGAGDRNLFKGFVELAPHLLIEGGRLGALLPAAFASDAGLAPLRERYIEQFEIARWTGYENKAGYFPIDSRYKFGLLVATRSSTGTKKLFVRAFAVEPEEVDAPHITLLRKDIELIGGKYHIFPELANASELSILRSMLKKGTPLFEPGCLGEVLYRREVDLTAGRKKGLFKHFAEQKLTPLDDGTFKNSEGVHLAPLMEGRLVGAYDCSQKSLVSGVGRTALWSDNLKKPLREARPQYVAELSGGKVFRVAICDITSSTNTRTVIATLVPKGWLCGNTAPVLEFQSEVYAFAGLGVLNSMVFDWLARRMVSGLHLNKFILEGFVWPQLDDDALGRVANSAWTICKAQPRGGLDVGQRKKPPFRKQMGAELSATTVEDALACIEIEVAKAFGLSLSELRNIYAESQSDRRGFWRFFASDPHARNVVSKVLSFF